VAEATRSAILRVHGNSDGLDSASLTEELPDSLLSCVEAEVTAEDSVCLTGCTAGGATNGRLLARELNLDLSVVEPEAVGLVHGLSGVGFVGEFDEADTLGEALRHDKSALGELTVLLEVSAEAVLVSIERK
jgi:hypothetical protein